ncbi:uncharacterized protein [Nicotiana tomentosiformis]|uniref:uncharacterized protein n=1 Tax=Nicotiana tomentosiformis TaxID=4098 RepID=UPI00051BF3A3|nr:uncharacterized protein LOC104104564 [Nicotiana tomentosiformis]
MGDIKDEIIYWRSAVIYYVLGSNPPQTVMEGYFKRVRGALGIDKIAQVIRGIFIVRFHSMENKEKVVEEGIRIFDKKPIVVKPWRHVIRLDKQVVDKIPVWIRLMNLDIKYWGQNTLTKIAGMIGNPLKADRTTTQKERLQYARILVEVEPNQMYRDMVMFENECGVIIDKEVRYEWKPVFCKSCVNFGHDIRECRMQLRQTKVVKEINKESGNMRNTNSYKEREEPDEQ